MDFWEKVAVTFMAVAIGAIVWVLVYALMTPNTAEPDTQVCAVVGGVAICGEN